MLSSVAILAVTTPLLVSARALAPRDTSPAPLTFPQLTGCPIAAEYSCENKTAITNTCCSPTPGGLTVVTSFWNTYTGLESSGQFLPARHWGVHGLWPDNCDGSYESYCDLSRQYDPLPSPNTTTGKPDGTPVPAWKGETTTEVLKRFGRLDLLSWMEGYWVNRGDKNEVLWAHEFSKHATCTSTFDKSCYASYTPGEDQIDFFQATIRAQKMFPNFDILASAGILPSNSTTTTLAALEGAFTAQIGAKPYFGCVKDDAGARTVLTEMQARLGGWIHAHVLGTPQFGQYKAIDTVTPSSCSNSTGIHYYERTKGSEVSKYS